VAHAVTEPLVIAHVLAPAAAGGLERVVEGLAAGHGARGHDVHVIEVFERGGPVTPLSLGQALGVTQHVLALPRRRYDRERAAVAALCRRIGARIMHTHGYRPDVVDAPAAGRSGCRSVTTVHGFTGGGTKNRLFEWLQVRAIRRLDAVVTVSRLLGEQLAARGVPRARLHVIPNAWSGSARAPLERAEARRALGVPLEGPCIGWVGRLSAEKAPDVLLDALERLPERPWTAAVVGAGPLLGDLRDRAMRAGLGGRVVWCGHVPDAARLFRAFDIFVLSSRTEGTPIALFEAMAARVPAIVTRVGGVPEVVSERDAWLVPPEDGAALAAALGEALARPDLAEQRAATAHGRLAAEFAPAPWLDRYEALYRALLAPPRAA